MTHTMAKQLVPVANRPILHFVLDQVARCGIRDTVMIVSPDTQDEVRRSVGDGSRFGLAVQFVPQHEPLGLAHAVRVARPYLEDEPFLMVLGDNLVGEDISPWVRSFDAAHVAASLLLKEVEDARSFGVAVLDDAGRVKQLIEKPEIPPSNLALIGMYIFDPKIHGVIEGLRPSARGEFEITDAIEGLRHAGETVVAQRLNSWWLDTGKKDDILEANRVVLDTCLERDILGDVDAASSVQGRVRIESGARITRTIIRGPVVIGRNAILEDVRVGPFTAIGEGAEIRQARIEFSVLLRGAKVRGPIELEESLIGRDAIVQRREFENRFARIFVGDDARVEVGA